MFPVEIEGEVFTLQKERGEGGGEVRLLSLGVDRLKTAPWRGRGGGGGSWVKLILRNGKVLK